MLDEDTEDTGGTPVLLGFALFECGGTGDDLGELGGDLGLTHAVELAFEQVGHLASVVGGGFHRDHAGDVLGDDRIVEALECDGFDGCGEQVIQE